MGFGILPSLAHEDDKKASSHDEHASMYSCPMHPEVVSVKPGKCPKCGMALKSREHMEPTIAVSLKPDHPLEAGKEAHVTVTLTKKDGSPVLLSDLETAHTKKIHLLIIDMSLMDYHHEHPIPSSKDGEYTFSFTPRKPGPYRVWADLHPKATDLQEYAMADIEASGIGGPLSDRSITNVAKVDGLTYTLSWDQTDIHKGKPVMGKLLITDADGKPFKQLEPIMGAYAHIVGFSEDFKTVVHIHPMGKEPEAETDRGGPELEFHFIPEKDGFIRLFAQVQVSGTSKFAPFGVVVKP